MDLMDIQQEKARHFMARALVMATMPHNRPKTNEFIRKNGAYTLRIIAPSDIGVPYATKPRLIMAYIASWAVLRKSRTIFLGRSQSEFMKNLGLYIGGGPNGSMPKVREQLIKLMHASFSLTYSHDHNMSYTGLQIASQAIYFWDPKNPDQQSVWQAELTLTEEFYREIIERPVPIDFKALQSLKNSSMAMDIYMWLTHRVFNLMKPVEIPWEYLSVQFGSDFGRLYDFKKFFIIQLKKVLNIYQVNILLTEKGIMIKPTLTHIHRKL